MFYKSEVEIAHQQGRGEPAQGQKHSEDETFNKDTHINDKRNIVSFIKEIEVKGLQDMFLAPGHHRRVDKIEYSQWDKEQGQCPAEIASEVPIFKIYQICNYSDFIC